MKKALQNYLATRIAADGLWGETTPAILIDNAKVSAGGKAFTQDYRAVCTLKGSLRIVLVADDELDTTHWIQAFSEQPIHAAPD